MKTVLLACLSLCLASGIAAVAQSPLNQATQEHQAVGSRLSTIMGTVRADGQTLTFVTDQRAWSVDNPEPGVVANVLRMSIIEHFSCCGALHPVLVKRRARDCHPEAQSGNPCRNGRHNPVASQLLPEQVQKVGLR